MEKVLNAWKSRKLTLIGRINIVKTLALSKLIFNASNLYAPPHVIDEANKLIFNFIWEVKPPKIKKSTIIGEKVNRGLKMMDFSIMELPLKYHGSKGYNKTLMQDGKLYQNACLVTSRPKLR